MRGRAGVAVCVCVGWLWVWMRGWVGVLQRALAGRDVGVHTLGSIRGEHGQVQHGLREVREEVRLSLLGIALCVRVCVWVWVSMCARCACVCRVSAS